MAQIWLSWPRMSGLFGDVRQAVRGLRKQPGFSIAAVLALALGIGSNTAIFSVIHGVLLTPLPYRNPDQLVSLWDEQPGTNHSSLSAPDVRDYRAQATTVENLAGYVHDRFTVTLPGGPERLRGLVTSPSFFEVLGVATEQGRTYGEHDSTGCVVVLSSAAAQRLGTDTPIVGRSITIDSRPCTVLGIVAVTRAFPPRTDLWMRADHDFPLMRGAPESTLSARGARYLKVLARLRPGTSVERAQQEMNVISARLAQAHPEDDQDHRAAVAALKPDLVRNLRSTLLGLFGSVAFVLLVAAANVASLQLARATVREHEMVTRAALGATRLRLLRQLLIENVVLALVGAGAGLLVAFWGIDALGALARAQLPRSEAIGIDFPVLGFTLGVAVATGLGFGIFPALHAASASPGVALRSSGRIAGRGGRARRVLVVAEIALAVALSTGAGVLVRSFVALSTVDPGFATAGVVTLHVTVPPSRAADPAALAAYYRELVGRVAAAPGVDRAGAILNLPMDGSNQTSDFMIDGRPRSGLDDRIYSDMQAVTPDYFRTLSIPVLAGRAFDEHDQMKGQPVAIVNQSFARRFFPGESPIGKRISWGEHDNPEWITIVGEVGDVHQQSLLEPPVPEVYQPVAQTHEPTLTLVIHGAAGIEAAVRRGIASCDPEQPTSGLEPLSAVVARSLAQRRFAMLLWSLFAAMALALVLVGVYGVVSYTVAQRTREIGIRIALGADAGRVVRLVLREGLWVALAGVAAGIAGALGVSRMVAGLVYGVSPLDPLTLCAVAALVVAVALLASALPAWRGTRIDPMVALRCD